MDLNRITECIIGAAIAVHRELGPGLLESSYEACMTLELSRTGLPFERQKMIPLLYRGYSLDAAYRVDFLVSNAVIVELKSIERIDAIHVAQVLTYLRLSGCPIGLLINCNEVSVRNGIRRIVLNYSGPRPQRPPR